MGYLIKPVDMTEEAQNKLRDQALKVAKEAKVKNKGLLLTPKEKGKIRAKIPGTTNVIDFAREVSDRTAKAQLAKVLPEIDRLKGESQARQEVIRRLVATIEGSIKQERERILDRLEIEFKVELLEVTPLNKYADSIDLLNLRRKKWTDFRQALKGK